MTTEIAPQLTAGDIIRVLNVEEMSRLTGLTIDSIRTYATNKKYQHLIPRPFKRPGGRRLLWLYTEVYEWLVSGRPATAQITAKKRGRPTKSAQLAARLRGVNGNG